MSMETNQYEELKRLVHETNSKVSDVHTVLFGYSGEGGFMAQHREFKAKTEAELDILKRHKEEINIFKAKLVAVVALASAIFSFFGNKLAAYIAKLNI